MTRARLVGAIRLADHYGLIPPDHGGLYGVGETLSYASQRLVDRPSAFSLADLKGCSSHTQITHQACEEGGAFIAQWTGVRLSYMLDLVGVDPRARYVVFSRSTILGIASTWLTRCIRKHTWPTG